MGDKDRQEITPEGQRAAAIAKLRKATAGLGKGTADVKTTTTPAAAASEPPATTTEPAAATPAAALEPTTTTEPTALEPANTGLKPHKAAHNEEMYQRANTVAFLVEHTETYVRLFNDLTGYDIQIKDYAEIQSIFHIGAHAAMVYYQPSHALLPFSNAVLFNLDSHTDLLKFDNPYVKCISETSQGAIPTMLFLSPITPVFGVLAALNFAQCIFGTEELELATPIIQAGAACATLNPVKAFTHILEFAQDWDDYTHTHVAGSTEETAHGEL
ncbi:MAG: hypothetical protein K0T99_03330 [Alphaproteobacteria bacterium]|nr:hypothetical protein [Alphaproteobacteria bacterium]